MDRSVGGRLGKVHKPLLLINEPICLTGLLNAISQQENFRQLGNRDLPSFGTLLSCIVL
jgi:hypothetical protein